MRVKSQVQYHLLNVDRKRENRCSMTLLVICTAISMN